jgi:hypothetical protein
MRGARAVSPVLGVALLLVVTVASLGALTVAVGSVVEGSADAVTVDRAADDLAALDVAARGGRLDERVAIAGGRLRTEPRTVRLLRGGRPVADYRTSALVVTAGGRRTAFLAGAVTTGREAATFREPPRVAATNGTLVVGVPVIVGVEGVAVEGDAAAGSGDVRLHGRVSHRRRTLPVGEYAVAVETTTPEPWAAWFAARGATVSRADLDGDGVESVLARYDGARTAVVVVNEVRLEVGA